MLKCVLAQLDSSLARELHRYITYGAKTYVLSADEALMAIRKVILVRIQGV